MTQLSVRNFYIMRQCPLYCITYDNSYFGEIILFCLATSPTATYEAEVIEVGIALLHGCCGIA